MSRENTQNVDTSSIVAPGTESDTAEGNATKDLLAERYGHTDTDRRNQRYWAIAGVTGVTVVLLAWLGWAGVGQPGSQFETRDLGYDLISEREVSVRFEVSTTPGTELSCAVQALNAQYGIVGWKVVDIPPAEVRTRVFNQPLRTSEPAVTGLLYECWLT
ncbi:DUF4307 domain-containing protein [Pontimonas sp.]|uniref:DUF4307 domain-containing protein n=1 Tax=Pontimonas sp. TaxID=2304492 RepID=UPI002870AE6C|nr:DUF4307 domain-containing protein [Pontimonas sp.]MDR9434684.1 DUF4307 domain-containing protein [Pontimonas sp.]